MTETADLQGFEVEARDGSIGAIDEATTDTGRAVILVDTHPPMLMRKLVIPAGTIEWMDLDNRKVIVSLTKQQMEDSPDYDPAVGYDDEAYRARLRSYYEQID